MSVNFYAIRDCPLLLIEHPKSERVIRYSMRSNVNVPSGGTVPPDSNGGPMTSSIGLCGVMSALGDV